MTRIRAALIAAALISLLAAGQATAAKSKGAKPKAATFRLEIKGEQLTTWTYDKVKAPQCDYPESESGRQYLTFSTYKTGDAARPLVKAKPGPGGGVKLSFVRNDLTISADAVMERNYRTLYSQIAACPGGEAGGENGNVDAIGSAHCTADGSLDFYFGSTLDEVANPVYPTDLEKRKPPKAALFFSADQYWLGSNASDHNLPSACVAEGQGEAAIGLDESQGEWGGSVIPVVGSLPAKKLLGGKAKKTVVELGRTVNYPNAVQTYAGPPNTKGKTRIDVTLTFTRVR